MWPQFPAGFGFNFCNKLFRGFKGWNKVLGNFHRHIPFNVAPNFGCPFFSDKTSETSDIDIFTLRQAVLYFFEHGFEGDQNVDFGYAGFLGDLVDEV